MYPSAVNLNPGSASFHAGTPYAASVQAFQRDYLTAALRAHRGVLGRAAVACGLSRNSFSNYLRMCGVDYLVIRAEIAGPVVAEKRSRQALSKRRCLRKAAGLPTDTPKRMPRPVRARVVPVLLPAKKVARAVAEVDCDGWAVSA